MKLFDKRTAQALLTALVFAVALWFLFAAWRAIIAFLFAVFFAYLLEAPVSRLEKWFRGSRGVAIAAVYLMFAAVLVVVFLLIGPPVMQEGQKLLEQAPQLAEKVSNAGALVQQLGTRHGWSPSSVEWAQQFMKEHQGELVAATQNFVLHAVRTLQNTWWLVLVPILAIFFLKDGRKIAEAIINAVEDRNNRQVVAETIEEMNSMLGHFIRAQLLLAVLAMVVITSVLVAMRVPYAFALGPAAGALEFIPVVGPFVGIIGIVAVAYMAGYGHVFWVLLFLLVWRAVQDYVSSPRIMGSTLELHPLMVLFGVFAGGEVAGVIGVFLSIPVLATLRILWHTWQITRKPAAMRATKQSV